MRPLLARSDFGAGFASPSDDGGLEEFSEFCRSRAGQVRDLHLKPGHQRTQIRDLRVPPGQQLTQPGVRRTQLRSGSTGRISHKRHYTTTSPSQQLGTRQTTARP